MNRQPRKTPRRSDKRAMNIQLFVFSLSLDACWRKLDTLEEYLRLTAAFLDEQKRAFADTFGDVAHDPDFHDAYSTEIEDLWRGFPSILTGSALVSVCSCFESCITDLFKAIQLDAPGIAHPWDRKHSGVRAAQAFLADNFGIH